MIVFSDTQVASMRLFFAFVILFPFVVGKLKRVKKKTWYYFLVPGILGNGIPAFLFTKAQTGINSSLSGIIDALTPLFALLIGIFVFRMKTIPINIIGVFVGLAGAIALLAVTGNGNFQFNAAYSSYVVLATICYAINLNFVKNCLNDVEPLVITGFAFMTVGPIAGIYLFSTDVISKFQTHDYAVLSLLAVVVLSLFGTALALIIYYWLIKRTSVLFVASVTYIMPVFSIIWGVMDGEHIGIIDMFFIAIILVGVYMVNVKQKEKKIVNS